VHVASHWLVSEETCARSIHAKVSAKVSVAHRGAARSGGGGTAVQWRRRYMACGHGKLWWKGCGSPRHKERVPRGQGQGPGRTEGVSATGG